MGQEDEERRGADGESSFQTLDVFVMSFALDVPALGVGVITRQYGEGQNWDRTRSDRKAPAPALKALPL